MSTLTFEHTVHFHRKGRGQKELRLGAEPMNSVPAGRVTRISRLMALAIRFEQLIRQGEISSYAELARLGHVTRARVTQIMNLLHLAPDIQEEILFLPRTVRGRDVIILCDLQPIAGEHSWRRQRGMWRRLKSI